MVAGITKAIGEDKKGDVTKADVEPKASRHGTLESGFGPSCRSQ